MRSLAAAAVALLMLTPEIAHSATVLDATGDFLSTFTGAKDTDLDVTSFTVNFNTATQIFALSATFAGAIDPSKTGVYVIGVNTGTPTNNFGSIGAPGVQFNTPTISIQKAGTASIGATALPTSDLTIAGNMFSLNVAASRFTSTGFTPENYGFNLWPRGTGTGTAAISDFAPNNATLSAAVPEPATWAMILAGFGAIGASLRRRRSPSPRTA